MFTETLLTKVKQWKQPKCPSFGEKINRVAIYMAEYYLLKRDTDAYYNLNKLKHYVKCTHVFHLREMPKIGKYKETEGLSLLRGQEDRVTFEGNEE